jgi:ribosome-binding protein aMBF1 (putative translation factor)
MSIVKECHVPLNSQNENVELPMGEQIRDALQSVIQDLKSGTARISRPPSSTLISECGQAIKQAREEEGMTREELAERSGVKLEMIIRLEDGNSANPSLKALDLLAAALCRTMTVVIGKKRGA